VGEKFAWYLLTTMGNIDGSHALVRRAILEKMPWWPDFYLQTEGRELTEAKLVNMVGTTLRKLITLALDPWYTSFIQAAAMPKIPLEFIEGVVGIQGGYTENKPSSVENTVFGFPSDLVNPDKAARLLGITRPAIIKLAREGMLRSFRVTPRTIRFSKADVLEYLRLAIQA
jgi:excisionase family DNA binding protein